MLEALRRTFINSAYLFRRRDFRDKTQLLWAYWKTEIGELIHGPTSRGKMESVELLGYRVRFFNHETVRILFEEVFLSGAYWFETSSSSPRIVDCGGNIGMSVMFFKRRYPNAKILVFEPSSSVFALLRTNVEGNKLVGVELINQAVWSREGTLKFYYDPVYQDSLVGSSRKESLERSAEAEVFCTKLSNYVTDEIDFLKMDIEGAEQEVVRDLAISGKLRLVREMVFEYHHHMCPNEDRLSELLSTLEQNSFGYEIKTFLRLPFSPRAFQAMLIHAYRK